MRQERPLPISPVVARDPWSGRALLRAGVGLLALEAAFAVMILLAAHPPVPRRPVVRIALAKPMPAAPRLMAAARRPAPALPIPSHRSPPIIVVALPEAREPGRRAPRALVLDGQENGHDGDPRRAFADRLVLASLPNAIRVERPPAAPAADQIARRSDALLAEISIPALPRRDALAGLSPVWRDASWRVAGPDRLAADELGVGSALAEGYGFHPDPDDVLPPQSVVPGPSVAELSELFASLDTPLYRGGQVPNVFLDRLPGDLADEPEARRRKALFLRTLLPLIVQANDRNLVLRREVTRLDEALTGGNGQEAEIADGMARLLAEFRLDAWDKTELLRRADMVPPSLALAQAATESGWGSSPFARDGNALFGQREFVGTAKSEGRPVPRLRRFEDLGAAVASYVRNLNTHPAYAEFRRARAALRAAGTAPSGPLLVGYLSRYSEQGPVYTRYIKAIMRSNDLAAFDRTELRRAAAGITNDDPGFLRKARLD